MDEQRFDINIPIVVHNNNSDENTSSSALQKNSHSANKNKELVFSFDEYKAIVDFLKNRFWDIHKNPFANSPVFLIATATGFRILHNVQIIYFKYEKQTKQWIAILNDNTTLLLKRKTTSENILSYSHSFVRINQHHIINLQHLKQIEGNCCIMDVPIENCVELTISRSYLKELISKFKLI